MIGINPLRLTAAIWGILGVFVLLGLPIYRLSATAWQAIVSGEMQIIHWLLMGANVLFMAYSEGYQGFQKGFSPRVAARVRYLSEQAGWFNGLLAPFFCFGYFGTTRKRQIVVITLSLMLVAVVMLVGMLPQPWRGIVDAGVVVGLLWGLASFLVCIVQVYRRDNYLQDAELRE